MGGHQIRHQELLLPKLVIKLVIFPDESFIDRFLRFPHLLKHRVRNMFRRYLELSTDMVLHQFPEERVVPVRHQIIKPDT